MPPPVRPILHIGNILNNGYLHCKYLRWRGVSADCLNVDYRHCQGQPEWAEVSIRAGVDEFNPDWSSIDLGGFQRPSWFFDVNQKDLSGLACTLLGDGDGPGGKEPAPLSEAVLTPGWEMAIARLRCRVAGMMETMGGVDVVRALRFRRNARRTALAGMNGKEAWKLAEPYMSAFRMLYPEREKCLSLEDIYEWLPRSLAYAPVLKQYRLIHAYSLDPIEVLLGNPGQPFLCYEHGTMRDFPFEDSARGRLYALCLKKADKVVITNADCIRSAKRLGLDNHVFIPHIIDDDLFRPEPEGEVPLRRRLRQERDFDFLLVAPSRHHWKHCPPGLENSWFKRNDILIRGLARLFREKPRLKALVVFFEWGQEVQLSKDLVRECGFADRVLWEPILSKPALKDYYVAADVILDQFNPGIGTFGAVVPEAMACARPVLLNYSEDLHRWCYPELPPAIHVWDEESICGEITRLLEDREYRLDKGCRGRRWFETYHSSRVVIDRMLDVYREISDRHRWGWKL
jgi:glycosyltransferase involved in cell wall biosynthesis